MSDLSQFNNYTDPSGNVYSNFTSNGKVTPYGYHFKNSVATGQFVAYVIWLTLFTVFTLGICCVRKRDKGKPNEERASYQYLRWPVMGVSTVCMLFIYIMQVYNRVVHETMKPIRWYYPAIIGVGVSVLSGTAQGLLIAFFLWQLTPMLLLYGRASRTRTKWTIWCFRFLTWLINLVNIAATIVTAMLWVLDVRKNYFKDTPNATEKKVTTISGINDAALSSTFSGMYLICVLIFAGVAAGALKHLQTAKKRFRILLSFLTAAMIFRSMLEFAWALVFKVWALRDTLKFEETLMTNLIRTVLCGFFSVVIYGCILCIAMLPLPEGIDHGAVNWEFLPKKAKAWHQRISFHGASRQPVYVPPQTEEIRKGQSAGVTVQEFRPSYGVDVYQYNGDPQYLYADRLNSEKSNGGRFQEGAEYPPLGQGNF